MHKNHVYALPGGKPTKKATATPVGIQTIKNIAKENPKSVVKYLNLSDVVIEDQFAKKYKQQLDSTGQVNLPVTMSLSEKTVQEISPLETIDESLLEIIDSLDFDIKDETYESPTVPSTSVEPSATGASSTTVESPSEKASVLVNQFDTKTKSELAKFDPNRNTCEGWVDSSVFALELGGITDEKKIVSHLMLAVQPRIQPSLRALIKKEIESTTPHKAVTVKIFKDALQTVAGKSNRDLDAIIENLTFQKGRYTSMREFYIDLEQYLKDLNPDISSDTAIEKLVSRQFKKKVPKEIRDAPAFQMSEARGLNLADLAQTLYANIKNSPAEVNYFSKAKPSNQRFQRRKPFNNRSIGYQPKPNVRSNQQSKLTQQQDKRNMRCYYCNKQGHMKSECRKLKKDVSGIRNINTQNRYNPRRRAPFPGRKRS